GSDAKLKLYGSPMARVTALQALQAMSATVTPDVVQLIRMLLRTADHEVVQFNAKEAAWVIVTLQKIGVSHSELQPVYEVFATDMEKQGMQMSFHTLCASIHAVSIMPDHL